MEPRSPSRCAKSFLPSGWTDIRLISNARHLRGSAMWLKFNRILCEKWFHKNIVLIGDAAHTAHFSIGSGTKLAMEDAIALSRVLSEHSGRHHRRSGSAIRRSARPKRSNCRAPRAIAWSGSSKSSATCTSMPEQFTYSLLTGSQRIGHENLKLRDANYVEQRGEMVRRALRRRPCRAADVHAIQGSRA